MFKRFWEYYQKHGRSLVFGLAAIGFAIAGVIEARNGNTWWIVWVCVSGTFTILSFTDD